MSHLFHICTMNCYSGGSDRFQRRCFKTKIDMVKGSLIFHFQLVPVAFFKQGRFFKFMSDLDSIMGLRGLLCKKTTVVPHSSLTTMKPLAENMHSSWMDRASLWTEDYPNWDI